MTNRAVELFLMAKEDDYLHEYKKVGRVRVQAILPGTKVDTIINGKKETTNTAKVGDVLITGEAGEQYLISNSKLKDRYKFLEIVKGGKEEIWEATGKCWAVKYVGMDTFVFEAPWDEKMVCNPGDYICSTSLDGADVYRIERNVFKKSYRLI